MHAMKTESHFAFNVYISVPARFRHLLANIWFELSLQDEDNFS